MQKIMFGTPETALVEAKAEDMLGCSSTAVIQVDILGLTVAVSDDVPLDVIASLANFGGSFPSLLSDTALVAAYFEEAWWRSFGTKRVSRCPYVMRRAPTMLFRRAY